MMQPEGSREMPPTGLREEETGPERRSYLPGVTQPTGGRGRIRRALVSCLPGRRRRENPERGGEGLLGRLEVKGDYLGVGVPWPRLMGKCLSTGRLPSASAQALCTDGRSGAEQG